MKTRIWDDFGSHTLQSSSEAVSLHAESMRKCDLIVSFVQAATLLCHACSNLRRIGPDKADQSFHTVEHDADIKIHAHNLSASFLTSVASEIDDTCTNAFTTACSLGFTLRACGKEGKHNFTFGPQDNGPPWSRERTD
jgi:hypothetical protein